MPHPRTAKWGGEMGERLTATEQAQVAAVYEHMAAVVAAAHDPAAVTRLAALLADNFTWLTPSSDPVRGVVRDRELYLAVVGNPAFVPEPEQFVDLELKILGTTVEGNRVAGESESYTLRRDGTLYNNLYHQLWIFDDAGKIQEYRIYEDSEHVASVHCESNVKVVRAFLDRLSAGEVVSAAALTKDDLAWTVLIDGDTERVFDKKATFALIGGGSGFSIAPRPDGVTAQGNRVIVEAETRTRPNDTPKWQTFAFEMDWCLIRAVREYGQSGPDHWLAWAATDG
jgi:ketosteroid isomerase-like protein